MLKMVASELQEHSRKTQQTCQEGFHGRSQAGEGYCEVKRYQVRLTDEAEQDLIDIYRHVASDDSIGAADYLIDELETLCSALSTTPQRGDIPPELDRIAVATCQEVHFKPYRVIYQLIGSEIFAHCVLDGRRDMQSLLERRLLR